MRKIVLFSFLCVMLLTLCACGGSPATSGENTDDAAADWYELNEENGVLALRLPANATTGFEWSFEISDPELAELLTQEYIADKAEADTVGSGSTGVASFCGLEGDGGDTQVTLNYAKGDELAEVRCVWISIDQDGLIAAVTDASVMDMTEEQKQ